jgi:uncharacterized protein (DUF1684 family)
MDTSPGAILALADWRRRVFDLYAAIRADLDPRHAWQGWCDVRHQLFVRHPQSPIPTDRRATYHGPPVHAYDPAARITAELRPLPAQMVEIGNSDGVTTRSVRFAEASFELYGQAATLEVFWLDAYGGGIYLSFRDATSGSTTYGGGRYLLDTVKGADLGVEGDRLILDFNFAYNPSCAYDPQWSCPLPPPANRLTFEIPVGETYG